MELEFWVTIYFGHGDGGDVVVTIDVSNEEYELLKQCCRDDEEVEGYKGLGDLYDHVVVAAKDESESCKPDDCEDIDYRNTKPKRPNSPKRWTTSSGT